MYEDVADFLTDAIVAQGQVARVHIERATRDNGSLCVPVYVDGDLDAYDKAHVLQTAEDEWNEREPPHEFQLFLIPAAR